VGRAQFFELRDRYARPEDGCENVAADVDAIEITVMERHRTKTVRYYRGCFGKKIQLHTRRIDQLASTTHLILDRTKWIELRNEEWSPYQPPWRIPDPPKPAGPK
jgi:hypothetical protein